MSFHVTVQGGEEDGRSFAVEGPCTVGRAPGCWVRLVDPKVSWEHASLTDTDGRLNLQNLSAAGVKVSGITTRGEKRVAHGDSLEFPGGVNLLVEERVGGKRNGLSVGLPVMLGALVLLLAAFGVLTFKVLKEDPVLSRPITRSHWFTAHDRLVERMEEWVQRDQFPEEAATLFRDAWRMELASNWGEALRRWEALGSAILTLKVPGPDTGTRSIAESGAGTEKALLVLMDWAADTSIAMDPSWNSDEAFAQALSKFVRDRAGANRRRVEADQ